MPVWRRTETCGTLIAAGSGVLMMVLLRATMARIRIDQTLKFFWSILTPIAMAQMILNLLLRGLLGL